MSLAKHVDPDAQKRRSDQFAADLAKMAEGQRKPEGGVQERILAKNFRLDVGGFAHNVWSAKLEEKQTIEHALDPKFWVDVVDKVRGHDRTKGPLDIIEVRKASTALYVRLLITEIAVGYIRTVVVEKAQAPVVEVTEGSPLVTRWNAGAQRHEVIRKADSAVMSTGFQSKASAIEWIDKHNAAMQV